MNRINFSEVDSTDEICKVFNRIIDNQNQIEGKLLQLIAVNKKLAPKSWVSKLLGSEKKGTSIVKTFLLIFVLMLVFAGNAHGYVTTDINDEIAANHVLLAQYLRDSFANVTSNSFLFTPTTTANAPSAAQGLVYFNSDTSLLQVSLDGSSFSPIDTAGGVSLDSAYDFGSAGGGRTILATDGAVQITNTQNDTASLLGLTYSGDTSGDGLTITMSVGSGDAIEIENTGTGLDIEGTGANFTVSKAGAVVGVIGTWTGDQTWTGSTANVIFDATDDELLIEDDAILSIGDDADFVFSYDNTDFNLEAAAANDDFRMGETTHFDLSIHGETNTNVVKFDTDNSALLCIFDGFDLRMNDDDVIIFGDSVASDSFTMEFDETTDNLLIVATTANDQVQFGDGTSSSTDVKMMAGTNDDFVLFDASADELFFEDCDLKINEGAQIEFSVADNSIDWTIDVSTDDTLLFLPALSNGAATYNIGDATNTSDVRIFGETASTVLFDATGDEVIFNAYDISMGDGDIIRLGDGDDITIAATGTTTTITLAAGSDLDILDTDNSLSKIIIGLAGGTHGLDLQINSVTADDTIAFNAATEILAITGISATLDDGSFAFGDGDAILLGDALGTGDISISSTSAVLTIDGVVAETGSVQIGITDLGLDFSLWAATNAEGVLWDASDEALEFTGTNVVLDGPGLVIDAMDETGTKIDVGTLVHFIFNPTTGEELNYTVPTGYDLLVLDAWGFKTVANGADAGDQWDIQNNSVNSIFSVLELATVSDTDRVQFDGLIDTEYEIEAGETLTLVAGEATDDDGADGIITIVGMFKVAD